MQGKAGRNFSFPVPNTPLHHPSSHSLTSTTIHCHPSSPISPTHHHLAGDLCAASTTTPFPLLLIFASPPAITPLSFFVQHPTPHPPPISPHPGHHHPQFPTTTMSTQFALHAQQLDDSQTKMDANLSSNIGMYNAVKAEAMAANAAMEKAENDMIQEQQAQVILQEELSALETAKCNTVLDKTDINDAIEQKQADLALKEADYTAKFTECTAILSTPGRSLNESKDQFNECFNTELQPRSDQIAQLTREIQYHSTLKLQRQNEEDEYSAKIAAKQQEIAERNLEIGRLQIIVLDKKCHFDVKMAHVRACCTITNAQQELRAKDDEIAQLKRQLEDLQAQTAALKLAAAE